MTFEAGLYFGLVSAAVCLTGFLAWQAWRHRQVPGAGYYSWMAMAMCFASFGEALSMGSENPGQALFWFQTRFLFFAFIPPLWLLFVLEYSGRRNWLSKRLVTGMFVIPLITQIMVLTSPLHGLWVKHEVGFRQDGPFWIAEIFRRIPGIWFLVHNFYVQIFMLAGSVLLLWTAGKKTKHHHHQALLLSASALVPVLVSATVTFNLLPKGSLNPIIPGLALGAAFAAAAIFRFDFFKKKLPSQDKPALPADTWEKSSQAFLGLLFGLSAIGIMAAGYFSFNNFKQQFRKQMDDRLSAIADLTSDRLMEWRTERILDAETLSRTPAFATLIQTHLENPAHVKTREMLQPTLDVLRQAHYQYDRVFLINTSGIECFASPDIPGPLAPQLIEEAADVLHSGRIAFFDFHRDTVETPVYLALLIPIYEKDDINRPLGVLGLRIDPEKRLYPYLKQWPATSKTAETLLIRRDGDSVLFLNELRFQKDSALALSIPLTMTENLSVKAVLGQTGTVEGRNYRGNPSIGNVRPIPDSPWFLAVSVDQDEVYAPLRVRLWETLLFFSALILFPGTGLLLALRKQRIRYYEKQIKTLEALRISEEKFRIAFETSPDAIAINRLKDGQYIFVNSGFVSILGYDFEEVIGRSSLDLNLWENSQDRKRLIAALEAKGKIETFEARFLNKDSQIRYGLMSAAVIHLDGEPHILSITRDITERKQADAERERLTTAIEQSGEAVIITSPEGVIQYVNPAFEKATGYTREEVLGQNPRLLKSGKQDAGFYRQLWATLLRGETFHGRIVNKKKDGALFTEDASISPVMDEDGNPIHYVAVKRDVTKDIQLEEQFNQAQKMESVGRLAGGVAHDFNNMLMIILSYTQMAINGTDPSDPIHKDLRQVLKAAERSAEITRQLLAFARKQTISPRVLDLNETVEHMLKMLRRLMGEDIDLIWMPGSGIWPVMIDPSQVDQILANLCVNARDAIAGVGKVTISTDHLTLDREYCAGRQGFVPGDVVMLTVSDTGCGIDKETLKHIYEPFFTTKATGQGTGLGLATVYGIVKQNKGFINVYSEPGQGTAFRIYLPRHTGDADLLIIPDEIEIPTGRNEIILIVEDESPILKAAKKMLKKLNYSVLAETSPDRAMDLAKKQSGDIHLLLTDVVMPEMSGPELAKKLKIMYPDLKILFMSGYTADIISHRGVLENSVNFISKPFTSKELAFKIRDVLDQKN